MSASFLVTILWVKNNLS